MWVFFFFRVWINRRTGQPKLERTWEKRARSKETEGKSTRSQEKKRKKKFFNIPLQIT